MSASCPGEFPRVLALCLGSAQRTVSRPDRWSWLKGKFCLFSFVGNWGPHLVVVRGCNILKWELELKRWCPGLKTLLYVGSHRELKAKRQVFDFKHEIKPDRIDPHLYRRQI